MLFPFGASMGIQESCPTSYVFTPPGLLPNFPPLQPAEFHPFFARFRSPLQRPATFEQSLQMTPGSWLMQNHPTPLVFSSKPTGSPSPQHLDKMSSTSSPPISPESKKKPPTKLFRPWLTETDSEDETTAAETSVPDSDIRKKLTGSRNENVTVRDEDPLLKQQSALEQIATNLGKSPAGGHRCIYCGKVYSRKYGLKIHLRTHTGFKPLKCKVCQRAFGDPSNLNKHTRLHAENGLAFKCKLCGKLLIRRRDLERHLTSRHGISATEGQTPDCCV